jgi:hypothetical protein
LAQQGRRLPPHFDGLLAAPQVTETASIPRIAVPVSWINRKKTHEILAYWSLRAVMVIAQLDSVRSPP